MKDKFMKNPQTKEFIELLKNYPDQFEPDLELTKPAQELCKKLYGDKSYKKKCEKKEKI